MLTNVKRLYALDMFTVENRGGRWFYSKSAYHGDKHEWKGPYSSLASATLMIARELRRAVTKREERHALPE